MVASADLPAAVRRGIPWIIVGQIASQVISLLAIAALFRLVAPEAFGLFGMALPWIVLPRMLATLGLSAAGVQQPTFASEQRDTLFWLQASMGIAFSCLAALLAPLASYLYQAPAVASLIVTLAPTVFIASLGATHQAILERQLQIARVTMVRLAGQLLGAMAAVCVAWYDGQQSALVVQQYGELLTLAISAWVAHPWWPGWPKRWSGAGQLLNFSGFYSLSSLLFALTQSADKLLLGLWLGSSIDGQAMIGAYQQAYNLMMRPVALVITPISGVLLPALSRAAHDRRQFAELATAAFRLAALLLLPCSIGLFVVANEVMDTLGGASRQTTAILLAALAPAIFAQGWINLCGSALAARGQTKLLAFMALMVLIVTLQALAAGYWFGLQIPSFAEVPAYGVAWGLTVATLLLLAPYVWTMLRATDLSPIVFFVMLVRPLRNSLLMGLIVLLVRSQLPLDWPAAVRLVVLMLVGMVSYVVLSGPDRVWLIKTVRSGRSA